MNVWQWIEAAVVLAIHDEQLTKHGGSTGIWDDGLIRSLTKKQTAFVCAEPSESFGRRWHLPAAACRGI